MKLEPLTQERIDWIIAHGECSMCDPQNERYLLALEAKELRRLTNVPGELAGIPCEMPTKLLLDAACKELVELRRDRDRLAEELRELRDAISPGRIATPNYYVGIAGRMRQRELQIKPQRSEIARRAGKAGGRGRKKGV